MFPSCISSSLDIRHFTCAFSCFPSRSSRNVLPILASFLTFLRVFLDSLRLLLLAFFGRSVSVFPAYFHSKPLSTSLNYNNFVRLTKLWLCWCSCWSSSISSPKFAWVKPIKSKKGVDVAEAFKEFEMSWWTKTSKTSDKWWKEFYNSTFQKLMKDKYIVLFVKKRRDYSQSSGRIQLHLDRQTLSLFHQIQ